MQSALKGAIEKEKLGTAVLDKVCPICNLPFLAKGIAK